jgi:hypothetical protein
LLPEHVERLLQAGHHVTVERSRLRCAPDAEYQRLLKEPLVQPPPPLPFFCSASRSFFGPQRRQRLREVPFLVWRAFPLSHESDAVRLSACACAVVCACAPYDGAVAAQVEEGSWKKAPRDAIILGLKELPEDVRGPHNTLHRTIIHDLFIDGYICVFICVCVHSLPGICHLRAGAWCATRTTRSSTSTSTLRTCSRAKREPRRSSSGTTILLPPPPLPPRALDQPLMHHHACTRDVPQICQGRRQAVGPRIPGRRQGRPRCRLLGRRRQGIHHHLPPSAFCLSFADDGRLSARVRGMADR